MQRIYKDQYPYLLRQIAKPPDFLCLDGTLPPANHKILCVVGSRAPSQYGIDVCKKLILGLSGYPITIVSGLAIGIDSLVHESAIEAGLQTIAFPGSGLDDKVLYPASRRPLARKIIEKGGGIISPFKMDQVAADWTFPVRNQLMANVSHATLVIEAKENSGSLITARAAAESDRDLLVVPGSVFSYLSRGTNALLREGGIAVCSSEDILESLRLTKEERASAVNLIDLASLNNVERSVLDIISSPKTRDDLLSELDISISDLNAAISKLEMHKLIREIDDLISPF